MGELCDAQSGGRLAEGRARKLQGSDRMATWSRGMSRDRKAVGPTGAPTPKSCSPLHPPQSQSQP